MDNFCYNTMMVLNFLAQTSTGIFDYEQYVEYIEYLLITETITPDIFEILMNNYSNKKTKSIGQYIDGIPTTTGRADYKVFKQYKKISKS